MKKVLFVLVLVLAASGCPAVWAQNAISNGAISGRVTDPSGSVVVGATVTCTRVDTGVQTTTKTNEAGIYNFPLLSVGAYNLSVSHPGFRTTEIKNAVVQVGQTTAQDATLQVGSLAESVTVTAAVPLLRATESSVSTVVNQDLIENLPLSGRRYTDFVLLTPNVTADGQFGLVSIGGQQGGADSGYANGNGSNSFTLDGANATSNYFGDARGRTRVPYVFGEQSIQEFQVADNPYNAAYGGAGTGFINTVTKSGTDTFHGDAFYYNRNSGTGSNDAIDNASGRKTPLNVLQQFGADLGGPIAHHKAWFYFDWEQQRQKEPISVVNTNFAGVTQTSFTNVTSSTVLPPPNGPFPVPGPFSSPPAPGDPNYPTYLQQVSNTLNLIHSNLGERKRRRDDRSFFPKVDWQPSTNDHLTFVYNYNRFNSPGGTFTFNPVAFEADQALPNNFVRDHHASIHYTHIFASNLLNDLHVSFLRDEQIGTPSGLVDPTFPQVGVLASGSFMGFGNPTFAVADTKEFQWEIGEQVNWIRGRHNFKFGFDFNRTHVTDFFPGGFQGDYFFLSPTALAIGEYLTYSQNAGNPVFPFTFPYYGFYIQDKFQARRNLTLDLGVREDFQVYSQPKENPAFPLTGQFSNQIKRVSPRLGFAYQPVAKTVVRGGFGMFYEVFNGINYESSVISNGLASQQSSASVFNPTAIGMGSTPGNALTPTFPGTLSTSGGLFSGSSNLSIVDPGFNIPYVLESSLEIQRELVANTTLTVGTMWTHGVHLISSSANDLNLIPPTGTTTYIVCPPGAGATPANPVSTTVCTGPTIVGPNLDSGLLTEGRINPALGQINALISPGLNNYNSFYVQIQRRMSEGLSFQIAYTLSKNLQSNGPDFNNQFDFRNTRGPTLLDQRHRVSVAAIYSPNASRLSNNFTRTLLSNWTISTVMQFNSGRTYTGLLNAACTGTDFTTCGSGTNLNDSAFNESTGNTALGINGGGPSPGIGYNAFYSPWIDEVDLGLARGFHITERQTITIKAQAFNLFNHSNFFVQAGRGINQTQYDPIGPTCGDGATANQTCFLVPDSGFKTLQSISELNGPRIFQFAFQYRF
jgi:carboxypeptidase family protein